MSGTMGGMGAAGGAGSPMPPAGGGAAAPDDGGDASSNIIVSIGKAADGSYMVFAGSPDDSADMSTDDASAMGAGAGAAAGAAGGAGAPPAGGPSGQPADSIGAALKMAMDLLQADQSSEGMAGSADDQLSAGFNSSQSPTPKSGPGQKY